MVHDLLGGLFRGFRSSLSRRIALAVFAGIVVIEIIILFPSYSNRETEQLAAMEEKARGLVTALYSAPEPSLEQALASAEMLSKASQVLGVALIDEQRDAFVLGDASPLILSLQSPSAVVERTRSADGQSYHVAFALHPDWGYDAVVLILDSSWIAGDLSAYVWRIAGLVLIIASFVTVVTMIVLSRMILSPLLQVHDRLKKAGEDRETLKLPTSQLARADEMGDVFRALSRMVGDLSESLSKIEVLARFPSENPNPVLRCNFDGDLQYANDMARAQAVFWDGVSNDRVSAGLRGLIRDARTEGKPVETELHFQKSVHAVTVAPVMEADYVNIYARDITALNAAETRLKKLNAELEQRVSQRTAQLETSESRLRSVIDNMLDGLIVIDDVGRIESFNPAAEKMFGYEAFEVLGRNVSMLMPEPDQSAHDGYLKRYREGGSPTIINKSREVVARRKDGSTFPIALAVSKLSLGTEIRYTGLVHDISDLKRREADLEAARESAEVANKAKSEFLATMSHEIRTPMNGVIGMTGLLLDTDLGEDQRHFAETIRQSGDALLALINDILDFSKMEAERLELEFEDFDLLQLVEGVIELLAPRAHERGVEMAYYIPTELQVLFEGDSGRLRQILINLLGNGIKFTPDGAVTLEVMGSDRGKGWVRFAVRDTGIGIPEEDQDRLFQSFSQVDSSSARRYEGTGLGLAICKRLVDLMGGVIGVESRKDEGSLFWFELPLPVTGCLVETPRREQAAALADLKILVVDDNPVNLDIFNRTLSGWGLQVAQAEGVEQAWQYLAENQVDVVLVDLLMPEQSGGVLVERLRADERSSEIKIVMASSVLANEAGDSVDLEKVDHFLTKPVRQSTLFNTLAELVASGPLTELIAERQDRANKAPKSSNPESAKRLGHLRVLVAEDNWVNQEVAVGYLENMGHRADVAANGQEAVDALRLLPYDVVLMDVQMPDMDGLTATREIRRMEPPVGEIPIVAMTANALEGDADRCFAAGMDRYLPKPVVREALEGVLIELFGDGEASLTTEAEGGDESASPPEGRSASENSDVLDHAILNELKRELSEAGVQRLIKSFFDNAQGRLDALKASLEGEDLSDLAKAAHSLKGVSSTLGFAAIHVIATALEQGAKEGRRADELVSLVADLEQKVPLVEAALGESYPELIP
ncbi:MAG: response regulator [Magnetovibrionaceae bacterium]